MSKCLLTTFLRKSPPFSMTFSRAFSCSNCLLANYYETLKISPNASTKEIKEAYFKLSKENHPDLHPNDPGCHDRFIRLQEAYKVLSNPNSRREYDTSSGSKRGGAYYHDTKRPYNPDFTARDEWLKRQKDEWVRQMKYGEHFGRRYDDPRDFNSYYSRPQNVSPEEMDLFMKRKKYNKTVTGANFVIVSLFLFVFVTIMESVFSTKTRYEQYNEMMMRKAEILRNAKESFYYDQAMWEERDRHAREMYDLKKEMDDD